jgi:hypothetical protein
VLPLYAPFLFGTFEAEYRQKVIPRFVPDGWDVSVFDIGNLKPTQDPPSKTEVGHPQPQPHPLPKRLWQTVEG